MTLFHITTIQICSLIIFQAIFLPVQHGQRHTDLYEYPISYRLNITFIVDPLNVTANTKLCYAYFGTTIDTQQTLHDMDLFFYSALALSPENIIEDVISSPRTALIENATFVDCPTTENTISTTTHFIIASYTDDTNAINDIFTYNRFFYNYSSQTIIQYFNGAIRINYNAINNVDYSTLKTPTTVSDSKLRYLWLLSLSIVFMIIFVLCCGIKQYNKDYIVDKGLVIIIGIYRFDKPEMLLPGVIADVRALKELWENVYNYDVVICNEKTLYVTEQDAFSFIDEHKIKLQNGAYKAVIVHILSHSRYDCFMTSDMKQISTKAIMRKLIEESSKHNNLRLIKFLFNHGCRGDDNFYTENNLENKRQTKASDMHAAGILSRIRNCNSSDIDVVSAWSNIVIVHQTISSRNVKDNEIFVQYICDAFKSNVSRLIKANFDSLLIQIGNKLEQRTQGAEICEVEERKLLFVSIRFETCTDKKTDNQQKNDPFDYTSQYDYGKIAQNSRYRSIPQNQMDEDSNDEQYEDIQDSKQIEMMTSKYTSIPTNEIVEEDSDNQDVEEEKTENKEAIHPSKQITVSDDVKLSLDDVNELVGNHRDIIFLTFLSLSISLSVIGLICSHFVVFLRFNKCRLFTSFIVLTINVFLI